MNEQARQGLAAALVDAVRERDRLTVVIEYLSDRLGQPTPSPSGDFPTGSPGSPRIDPATGKADPMSLISEGELFGRSMTAASHIVLTKIGRPNSLKTEELVQALRKGGVPVKNGGTLYRSLDRNGKFRRVGRGLWGLSEWYPTGPARTAKAEEPAEPAEEPESEERPDEVA